MELKSLRGLGAREAVQVRARTWSTWSSFGGTTREYQVRVDPNKLIAYGLNIGQVEQQLANNNVNAGGSFIEAGLQQINVRAVGLVRDGSRHRRDRPQDPERHAGPGQRHRRRWRRDRRSGWARSARPFTAQTARSSTTTTWSRASCCCARAPIRDATLEAIHEKVEELNEHILPPRGEDRSVPRPQRPGALTTHTVLHNLTEGIILVSVILFLFLGNVRGALDRRADHSVLAAVRVDLSGPAPYSGEPAVAGRAGFRHDRGRRGGDGGEHRAPPGPAADREAAADRGAADPRGGARSAAAGVLFDRASSSPPTCRSSRCSAWKAGCSSRWRGRSRSRCWARCCFRCCSRRCWRASCSARARESGTTR